MRIKVLGQASSASSDIVGQRHHLGRRSVLDNRLREPVHPTVDEAPGLQAHARDRANQGEGGAEDTSPLVSGSGKRVGNRRK